MVIMMAGLIVSGITAFPLHAELQLLDQWLAANNFHNRFCLWIHRVTIGLTDVHDNYPFIAYGTDWLAFAHFVIAIAFLGPYRDPVKNSWVIDWGIIACIMVIPMALVAGPLRGIPFFHQLIDCLFGVTAFTLLFTCRRLISAIKFSAYSTHKNP